MNTIKISALLAISFFLTSLAAVKNYYIISKEYTVTIHGTSNLHDWEEKVGIVNGEGIANWNGDTSFDLEAVNIRMEVYSIKSDNGSVMDNATYKALKADINPQIIFTLTTPLKSIRSKSSKSIYAKGNLSIAGITKSIDMPVIVSVREHGKLSFEGSQTIKMSDFYVNPPTALFGALKTGNEITINFKTTLILKN